MVKRSKQKELILRVLQDNPHHQTAVQIYDEVRKEMPHISLATIYRNLKQFQELGEITEFDAGSGLSRFDGRIDPHGHFCCDKCGRIFDIEKMVTDELNGRLARGNGFEVSKYQLVLHGLCPDCQPNREANNAP